MAKDDMNFAKQEEVSTDGFCFVTITRMAVVQGYVRKKNKKKLVQFLAKRQTKQTDKFIVQLECCST